MKLRTEKVVLDESGTRKAVSILVDRSAWFQVEPLPDGEWEVQFKAGEGHAEAIIPKSSVRLTFNLKNGPGQWACRGCGRTITAVAEGEPCYNCRTPHRTKEG